MSKLINTKYEYDIHETVYHITPESPKGIVIGRRVVTDPYYFIEYLVAFSHDESLWCGELELSRDKAII